MDSLAYKLGYKLNLRGSSTRLFIYKSVATIIKLSLLRMYFTVLKFQNVILSPKLIKMSSSVGQLRAMVYYINTIKISQTLCVKLKSLKKFLVNDLVSLATLVVNEVL